jgi:hypothetical protein
MSAPAASALAQERLRARARRIVRLRKQVAAVALATFALAFGVIAYDGSIGTTMTTASASTQTSTDSQSSSNTQSSSSGTTTMTTRQS